MNSTITGSIIIAVGVIISLLELVVPGLVIIFFGIGAVITGIAVLLGLVTSISTGLLLWVILSALFFIIFRRLMLKLIPSSSSYQYVEEDVDNTGKIVEVTSRIEGKNPGGRIAINGVSWQAFSSDEVIEKGEKVRILFRDNISYIVERIHQNQEGGDN